MWEKQRQAINIPPMHKPPCYIQIIYAASGNHGNKNSRTYVQVGCEHINSESAVANSSTPKKTQPVLPDPIKKEKATITNSGDLKIYGSNASNGSNGTPQPHPCWRFPRSIAGHRQILSCAVQHNPFLTPDTLIGHLPDTLGGHLLLERGRGIAPSVE